MKKLLNLLLTVCALCLALSFAGCVEDDRTPPEGKIEQGYSLCYAFTATSSETSITDTTSVYDYMQALSKNGKLVYGGENSSYGYYLTSLFGVETKMQYEGNSSKGYGWAFYTTLTSIDGVAYSSDYSTFNYNGITMYSASNGVSYTPCVEGATYAFVYEYSEMSW